MPLQQRLIEPVHVCRNTLPLDDNGVLSVDVPNELECVTNGTLANIIRQLSSLSKQAEDIFGSLVRESTSIAARTNSLQGRVDRLAIKVTQLDSNVEEVSLQDIHMRKAFKSSVVYDQQVVSRESIPAAIKEIYLMCDKPPPLDKLNPYREDGKDGLKFYTDANYFFDLWKQEMLKDTERLAHDKGRKLAHIKEGTEPNQPRQERKRHKKVRQPHNTREKYRMMATKDEFLDKTANYSHLPYGMNHRPSSHAGDAVDNHNGYPVRPSSLELQTAYGSGQESGYLSSPTHHYPPPPPAYIEHPQSPTHGGYPPPPYAVATPEQGGGSSVGTPTRQLSRVATMVRPSQPPPAPPISSNSSSGTSTPTVSATGTPSSGAGRYYKGSSHSRDNLPPPPPPPEGTVLNGGIGQSHFVINNDVKATRGPNGSVPHTPTRVVQQGGSRHGTPTHHAITNHGTSILIQHNNNNNNNNANNNRDQTPPPAAVSVIVNQTTHPTPETLDLPPPPPTPDKDAPPSRPESQLPPSPPPPPPPAAAVLPPPPPPMPLPNQLPNGPVTNGGTSAGETRANEAASVSSESASTSSSLSKGSENQEKGKGGTDARSDLLAAIREGIKLRRVEDIKQKEVEKAAPLHDVASILARRIAMEFSDSDSASYSECDSDAWDDETEC